MPGSSSPESDDLYPDPELSLSAYLETLQDIQQRQLDLNVEVERIHKKVDQFRLFFQTLVSGLVLAILIAFGIAIWYAYRSFSQQQIARQAAEEITATQEELITQVEQLETRLRRLQQELPDEVAAVTDDVQSGRVELRRLRDRLNDVEAQLDILEQQETEAPPDAPTN